MLFRLASFVKALYVTNVDIFILILNKLIDLKKVGLIGTRTHILHATMFTSQFYNFGGLFCLSIVIP
jgi:hypothetical protein